MILKRKYQLIMNVKKIQRIKREYGLITKVRRKRPFVINQQKQLESRVSANYLNMEFNQKCPDKVYSTDISYLPYCGGRAYLSATKDLATKEIVAFNVSRDLELKTGFESIEKKLSSMKICERKELMIHSDQGFHYTNPYYVSKLSEYGVKQSMSRRGNCLDNAPIESFFGHLKDELEINTCKTYEEVRERVNNYVHYYNNERCQWGLKKMTPKEYRCHLLNHKNLKT